jgi:hypothetical protein
MDWGTGTESVLAEPVFDVTTAAPEVFAAVCAASPQVESALDALRRGIPVMATAAPGEQGRLYRMRGHNRSVCIALADDRRTSDVIVLKGSEPLLGDFEEYLDWMQRRQFGTWPRPIMEHFPLFEGKAPGTVFLDEARKEAALALAVQAAHLRHYGELLRVPVPLAVFRLTPEREAAVIAALEARMSGMAFERVEPHLRRGIGIFAYHYPGPPVRVHAVGRPRFLWPAGEAIAQPARVGDTMVPGWIRLAARLFSLGFFPATPLSFRLGTVFDPNNSCLDGGACDIGSILPMTESPSEGFFTRSVLMTIGGLRVLIARGYGVPMAELAQTPEQEVAAFYLGDFVRRGLLRAFEVEARPGLTLDPRVRRLFEGDKSLPEVLSICETFNSYLGVTEYVPTPTFG